MEVNMDEENVREYQDVREYQEKKSGVRKGILFGVLSTILVGLIGINLVCYATGTQIVITPKMSSKGSVVDTDTLVKINELTAYVDTYFYEEVDREKLRDGLYSGLLEGIGDKYSVYYNADEYQQMQIDTTGKYYGIGAGLTQDKDTMVVTISKVYEGTPSEAAGLMAEDIILSVDDIEATSMEVTDLVKEIRGEEGTTVHLEIYRPSTGEYLSFDVERANVVLPSISSEMLSDGIGYIRIESFESETASQFEISLADLESQGMESLIVDLRYNGGGLLDAVVKILDDVLPEGLLVYVEDKNGKRQEYYSSGDTQIDYPMAVLINESSASASEIFAGAIKDYEYGTLIGTKTYGKGIVQTIFPLEDGDALKLTTARYFTPKGNYIHGVGIEPDIELEYEYLDPEGEKYEMQYDNQIQKAIEVLRGE
ncbi:MAG: S41 family peptidase [Roseburia sp.]|nr:S41 family peptidase [Roseburia sp.]